MLGWATRVVMKNNVTAVAVFALYLFAVLFYLVLVLTIIIFNIFRYVCERVR